MTLYADSYLEKLATSRHQALDEWEKTLTPQKKKEQELVRKAQSGDIFAMRQLKSLYTNNINQSIRQSKLNQVVDHATARQIANSHFKKLVEKYDPIKAGGEFATFFTYYTKTMLELLKTERYQHRDFAVRKSDTLTMNSEIVSSAEKLLEQELGRSPGSEEIYEYIQNNFETGKSLTPREIDRIKAYDRRELSGSQIIGGSESGEASAMTFSDMVEGEGVSSSDVEAVHMNLKKAESAIRQMPLQRQRFIRNMYGLGSFRGNRARNLNQAVLNNNLTRHEGEKALKQFRELLKKEGV